MSKLRSTLSANFRNQDPNQAGFSLIELLIVVSISILLMLAASSLFMTFLIGSAKTNSAKLIKNEGEYALAQMEFLLRNATEILSVDDNGVIKTCENNMGAIRFRSIDNGITTLTRSVDPTDSQFKIASNSGFLTSSGLTLVSGPTFNCAQSDDSVSQYVTINFTLRKGSPGVDEARDIIQQDFTSGVQIRTQ
jgi:prepilin-type N-terminal cleavage/methylation domain-containing protein